MSDGIRAEYEFTLPMGYVDAEGVLHKHGWMRLATAADEIFSEKDPRVQNNRAYLPIIILSRVITKLGDIESINTKIIEDLFVADLTYLQNFYQQINHQVGNGAESSCPKCQNILSE